MSSGRQWPLVDEASRRLWCPWPGVRAEVVAFFSTRAREGKEARAENRAYVNARGGKVLRLAASEFLKVTWRGTGPRREDDPLPPSVMLSYPHIPGLIDALGEALEGCAEDANWKRSPEGEYRLTKRGREEWWEALCVGGGRIGLSLYPTRDGRATGVRMWVADSGSCSEVHWREMEAFLRMLKQLNLSEEAGRLMAAACAAEAAGAWAPVPEFAPAERPRRSGN